MSHRYPLKRPLFVVGMSFGLALLLATTVGFHVALIGAVLCALLFALSLAVRALRQYEGVTAALLAAGAAFAMFAGWEYVAVRPLQQMDGQTLTLTLWMEEEVSQSDYSTAYFARVRDGDLPRDTRLLLWVDNDTAVPQLYDCVETTVQVVATDNWRAERVFLEGWSESCTVTATEVRPWYYALRRWRQDVLDTVQTRADGDVAALLRAICFGDKSQLSVQVKEGFAAAGISHITAVSGFHMNVVAMGVFALWRFFGLRRRRAALLSLPLPFLFAALTGFSYSAMRAGGMACLLLLGALFRRKSDGRNALGGAVLLLLATDCTAVYDLGLQLSVAATCGILLAASLQPKTEPSRPQRLGRGLQLTLAAVAATLPFSAWNFGETSVLAPLTNLIAQPLAAVIVSMGCVGTLLLSVPFFSFVGTPLILISGVAARGLLWLGDVARALPIAFWRLDEPYLVLWAAAVPLALLAGWYCLKVRGLRITAMMLVIALCASTLVFRLGMRGVTEFSALNLSDGAIVLLTRDGHHAAVVTGEPTAEQVQHALDFWGVRELDVVLHTGEATTVQTAVLAKNYAPVADEKHAHTAGEVTLWGNTAVQWQDGWSRITVGSHTVLIAPRNGTAEDLPAAYQTAEVAIFDRVPPQHSETLALGRAVLCCSEETLPMVTRKLMWGVYPIAVTCDEAVTIKLR